MLFNALKVPKLLHGQFLTLKAGAGQQLDKHLQNMLISPSGFMALIAASVSFSLCGWQGN